jgi:putative transposase
MIFAFIQAHQQHWPVAVLCDTLGVSRAGFYAWQKRPASTRQQRRDALLVEIRAIHSEVKERYGSPRVAEELARRGVPCCVTCQGTRTSTRLGDTNCYEPNR